MTRYLALLRGINVGGNNIIKMVALKAAFEALGFADVATYIQSGNVVFASKSANKLKLTKLIEDALTKTFSYGAMVVLVSRDELTRIAREAPPKFGTEPARYRYDVLFVKPPLMAREALADVPTKAGVDEAHAGEHALYFRRLVARAGESRLPKLATLPVYKSLTVRNWNTTTKLVTLVTVT